VATVRADGFSVAGRRRRRSAGQSAARGAPQRAVRARCLAGQQHTAPAPAGARLAHTPQQWVAQWTAAALQSPSEVCDRLYAPALARAFKGDTGHSCARYYTSVKSSSFRIRHVLQDGPAAAVEAQEVGTGRKWGYFTMLLSHVHGGWQAVDVVPGGSVRAR
jgi:hypothetical protein